MPVKEYKQASRKILWWRSPLLVKRFQGHP
jgi:hypothetical protein